MINQENVKIFNDKIISLLNNIIPGVVILEIFFKQGFFSKTPEHLYSFILYLIWSYLLSIPFNFFESLDFEKITKKLVKKRTESISENEKQKINDDLEKYFEEEKVENDKLNNIIQFMFILVYILLIYIAYKIINEFFIVTSFWRINISFINLFICLLTVFIVTIPLRCLTDKLFYNYLEKQIQK